jgi:hypothetical protein
MPFQPDPYMVFLEAVMKAKTEIGENMAGFVLSFAAKKLHHPDGGQFPGVADDQLLFTWSTGGHPAVVNQAYLDMAVNLLERFVASNRGNLYVATEMMKARILEKLMQRERERRP